MNDPYKLMQEIALHKRMEDDYQVHIIFWYTSETLIVLMIPGYPSRLLLLRCQYISNLNESMFLFSMFLFTSLSAIQAIAGLEGLVLTAV